MQMHTWLDGKIHTFRCHKTFSPSIKTILIKTKKNYFPTISTCVSSMYLYRRMSILKIMFIVNLQNYISKTLFLSSFDVNVSITPPVSFSLDLDKIFTFTHSLPRTLSIFLPLSLHLRSKTTPKNRTTLIYPFRPLHLNHVSHEFRQNIYPKKNKKKKKLFSPEPDQR